MSGPETNCRAWLAKAENDLLNIENNLSAARIPWDTICFHAQQAAEKALKAVLIANGIPFGKVHNLKTLLDLLPQDTALPPKVQDAASLTDYAVSRRYPGDFEPITRNEAKKAVKIAREIRNEIRDKLPKSVLG